MVIIFWAVFKQNASALTTFAETYTERSIPASVQLIVKPFGMIQTVTTDTAEYPKYDQNFKLIKDADGNITEIHCTYDKDSRSGSGTEASLRKVKGTLHWVSIQHAKKAEVRLYDRLFSEEFPDADKEVNFKIFLNSDSLKIITGFIEPSIEGGEVGKRYQFQRLGYFCIDLDSTKDNLLINKTVGLKDTWSKSQN